MSFSKSLPDRLIVEILPSKRKKRRKGSLKNYAMLVEMFRCHRIDKGNDIMWELTIPPGFKTDFASVPRIFSRAIPKMDDHMPAAVVHDFLYRQGTLTRKEADDLFLSLMKELGIPYWKRYSMYWGVRAGGRKSYKGEKK